MNTTAFPINEQLVNQNLQPFGLLVGGEEKSIHELTIDEVRRNINNHRLVVLRGFKQLNKTELVEYCSNWGNLLNWDFGVVFEIIAHENPTNYLLSNERVPFHWDGAFIGTVPSLEIFQCLKAPAPGTGGETLFCDTTKIWQDSTSEQKKVWEKIEITYATESNSAHYKGQITVPLVSPHPHSKKICLRFGEPLDLDVSHLTRLSMRISGLPVEKHSSFIREMRSLIYSPRNCIAHKWQDGDIVIGDNHALLHARNKFLETTHRHLRRVHVI